MSRGPAPPLLPALRAHRVSSRACDGGRGNVRGGSRGRCGGGRGRGSAEPRAVGGRCPSVRPIAAMQNVINTVKGKALEVAEYLTPVLKVPVLRGSWDGEEGHPWPPPPAGALPSPSSGSRSACPGSCGCPCRPVPRSCLAACLEGRGAGRAGHSRRPSSRTGPEGMGEPQLALTSRWEGGAFTWEGPDFRRTGVAAPASQGNDLNIVVVFC